MYEGQDSVSFKVHLLIFLTFFLYFFSSSLSPKNNSIITHLLLEYSSKHVLDIQPNMLEATVADMQTMVISEKIAPKRGHNGELKLQASNDVS